MAQLKRHTTDAVNYGQVFGKIDSYKGGPIATNSNRNKGSTIAADITQGSALFRAHCQFFGSRNSLYIPPFQKAKV